jgi:RNA polymerase sigma-70 factor, ECF subfamily
MFALPLKRRPGSEDLLENSAVVASRAAPASEARTSGSMPTAAGDAGGEARIRRAFDQHLNAVWRVLRRLGVPAAAVDDAAQRVFIVLARRIDDVELGSERAFLLSTATRVASEIRRSPGHARVLAEDSSALDLQVDPEPLPDEMVERRRASELLDLILGQMSDSLREAFVLYEFEAFTVPQIAELLDIPVGTAASRLRRGREEFKSRVAKLELARSRRGGAT